MNKDEAMQLVDKMLDERWLRNKRKLIIANYNIAFWIYFMIAVIATPYVHEQYGLLYSGILAVSAILALPVALLASWFHIKRLVLPQ